MKQDYLQRVKSFYARNRRLPTYTEMLSLFNVASRNAVHWIVKKWIEQGLLQKIGNRLAPTGDFFAVPVLGTIPAGTPALDEHSYANESISLDEYCISNPGSTYLLRVSGDSMIGAGIQDGDLAIIDAHRTPATGDIVAAFIDGAWTLKYFNRKNGAVYLTAANPAYPTLLPREELRIGGVVTKIIKEYY
ncbi:MAG TPA: S24 family peptidase [Patescibacteria group bacterium]|nr:S24 family peptidase [Patescibacteria group bacterium]